jgi:hypothetical protein
MIGTQITQDIEALCREVDARNREIQHLLQAAAAFERELAAMANMAVRMQRMVDGFRLPIFDDPIRWPCTHRYTVVPTWPA